MPLTDIQPAGWKAPKGYANGMLGEGRVLCIGGQIGWNTDQRFEVHDFIGQMQQTLRNIVEVVEAAGGHIEDIARLTWFVCATLSRWLKRQVARLKISRA